MKPVKQIQNHLLKQDSTALKITTQPQWSRNDATSNMSKSSLRDRQQEGENRSTMWLLCRWSFGALFFFFLFRLSTFWVQGSSPFGELTSISLQNLSGCGATGALHCCHYGEQMISCHVSSGLSSQLIVRDVDSQVFHRLSSHVRYSVDSKSSNCREKKLDLYFLNIWRPWL